MVENTGKRDPMLHLIGMMSEGQSDYIEGMEAEGQKQVVADSEVMPADGPWDALRTLGFGEPVPIEGDDMFVRTRLPEGWAKQPTNHSMWSEVIDERGIERVAVFYKAAFYDRSAHSQVVNVGRRLASNKIYGDDPVGLPEKWDLLTDVERTNYIDEIDNYLERAERHPDIYGDRAERAKALEDAAAAVRTRVEDEEC